MWIDAEVLSLFAGLIAGLVVTLVTETRKCNHLEEMRELKSETISKLKDQNSLLIESQKKEINRIKSQSGIILPAEPDFKPYRKVCIMCEPIISRAEERDSTGKIIGRNVKLTCQKKDACEYIRGLK